LQIIGQICIFDSSVTRIPKLTTTKQQTSLNQIYCASFPNPSRTVTSEGSTEKYRTGKMRDHLDQRATDTTGKWGTKFPG